jgi:hypothetical protein
MYEQALHGESIAGRAASVRRKLKDLSADVRSSTFDLADLLFEAQENNYPYQWGFASLPEYAAEELGLKARKAQYLTRITKVCRAVGLTRERYEPAGTSKLREICTLDPEGSYWNPDTHANESLDEHIVRLILDSDNMTVEQIKEEVLRLQGRTGADRPVHRSYTVPKSAYENVIKPAFELIRRQLGSQGRDSDGIAIEYSDGAVLECICAEILSNPNNQPEPEEASLPPLPMENL